ncbi:MAG: non-ribosomal peptide synthetase, partial [bacterium]|nr:non-ribosomal peptide synthetase [bacterium]
IFKLLRMEQDKYFFIFNTHHIINDGWSLGIINNEVFTLYNTFLNPKENPLPPLKLQYRDYTLWHNSFIETGGVSRFETYWLEKFKDKPNGIDLPFDHARRPIQTFNGGRVYFTLGRKETAHLHRVSHSQDVTLFMSMLSLVMTLLYRYSGQQDMILAAPVAGRRKEELQTIMGFLVNTLVYRLEMNPKDTFRNFLRQVKQEAAEAYQNQDYPFDLLVEKIEPERDLSQSPLFNVM